MELKSRIVYIKEIAPGDAVSYGGTFVAEKPMRIATISVGYGDGYPRSLSNKGLRSDPWKESADPRPDLYGSVYGGCDGYSGSGASWRK